MVKAVGISVGVVSVRVMRPMRMNVVLKVFITRSTVNDWELRGADFGICHSSVPLMI